MVESGSVFDLGRVIQRTFGIIGRNLTAFALLALVLAGLPALAGGAFGTSWAVGMVNGDPGSIIGYILILLLSVVAAYLLIGALTHGAIVDLNGRRPSFGECLNTGIRNLLPLVALGLLLGLAFMGIAVGVALVAGLLAGLLGAAGGGVLAGVVVVLLMLPALVAIVYLAARWLVAAPAYIVERPGVTGAFARSSALTKGHRWSIVALMVMYLILALVIQFAVLIPAGLFAASGGSEMMASPMVIAFTVVYSVINSMIGSVGVAAIYYELRTAKDGVTSDALASVFA